MRLHILGICGTFMGGIALLARALGHEVSGSDANVYPPMSTQLAEQGIALLEGYKPEHLKPASDWVVVGNSMSRGNPAVEYMLDAGLRYTSGPQWLAEHVLHGRWVLAVAGTHGKTSTASMLSWILEAAGLAPGFLVGGVPENFSVSARLGDSRFFVIEADEYDTAFFDKRSKFVHYRPRTLVLNNLEFDHADIFDDLPMIQRQFHHLVRTVPGSGLLIAPARDPAMQEVLEQGVWTPLQTFAEGGDATWRAERASADGSRFDVLCEGNTVGTVEWDLTGGHNVANALAALAAARHAGVPPEEAVPTLALYRNVKRRMELRGEVNGIAVYDDFAHHPTAISATLQGIRAKVGKNRILVVLEPRSNTMRMGVHADRLAQSLQSADKVMIYEPPDLTWNLLSTLSILGERVEVFDSVQAIVDAVGEQALRGDHVVVMSNGGFENIHQRLLDRLSTIIV